MDTPVISLQPGGGFRVKQGDHEGTGASLPEALAALSAAIAASHSSEKGDETAAAETARLQTDILANDRFIRGNAVQHNVMLAAALGLI